LQAYRLAQADVELVGAEHGVFVWPGCRVQCAALIAPYSAEIRTIDPASFIRDSSGIFHTRILEELLHPVR
jgi:hypothetical protein